MCQYCLGIGVTVPVIIAAGLFVFQRRLIYPADFPEGSRKCEQSKAMTGH